MATWVVLVEAAANGGGGVTGLVDADARLVLAGVNENVETRLWTRDGTVAQVLSSAGSAFDRDGGYEGALAMVTDVTARLEAEDVLRRQAFAEVAGADEGFGWLQ